MAKDDFVFRVCLYISDALKGNEKMVFIYKQFPTFGHLKLWPTKKNFLNFKNFFSIKKERVLYTQVSFFKLFELFWTILETLFETSVYIRIYRVRLVLWLHDECKSHNNLKKNTNSIRSGFSVVSGDFTTNVIIICR